MKKRRTFDREFKQMVIELSNNREDISALAAVFSTATNSAYQDKANRYAD